MLELYMNVLKQHYADFNGRARRKEYWTFALINVAVITVLYVLAIILAQIAGILATIMMALYGIFALAILVPTLAVGIRRLHDTSKPTWMIVLNFIPIANLYFLYLMIIEGDKGDNEFGPDPKAGE